MLTGHHPDATHDHSNETRAWQLPRPCVPPPLLSIVIPVLNEQDNVVPLLDEITQVLAAYNDWEVIFVDDGSIDETAAQLRPRLTEQVRLLQHGHRCGQSMAIRSGVHAARGPWIATLDGDRQNDPTDLPAMLSLTWQPIPPNPAPALVAGIRRQRQDKPTKRAASWIANGIRRLVLQDGCRDSGCGLKVFRRSAYLDLPFFASMHRFLPALFLARGYLVAYTDVNHRVRAAGRSKYGNVARGLVGILDLLGVCWLKLRASRYPKTPKD